MTAPTKSRPVPPGHAGCYADWLAVAAPRLPEHLVAPARLAPAMRIATYLPGDCLGGFEIRLGAAGPGEPVDLAIQLTEPRQAQELMARMPTARLRASLAEWAAGRISTEELPSFWLEYDADGIGDVDPDGGKIPEPLLIVQLSNRVRARWFVDDFLPAFLGFTPPARQVTRAARALQKLPPGLRPLYLFGLRSRGSTAIRIDTIGTEATGMGEFLRSVISDDVARCAEAALPLLDGVERTHLSFEVTPDGFGTRIGMEASYRRQPAQDPRWQTLLSRLVEHDLCTSAQRDALLSWPGHDTARTVAAWPRDATGAPVRGVCAYALSHVKLSMSPERPLSAKAYLVVKLVMR